MDADQHSTDPIRKLRRCKAEATTGSPDEPLTLDDIPPDAPMEDGIVLGCWDGRAFVSWERWLALQPVEAFREEPREVQPASLPELTPAQKRTTHSHCAITASLFD